MGHILNWLDDLNGVIWVIYYTHGRTGHPPYQKWLPIHKFLHMYWHTQNWFPMCLQMVTSVTFMAIHSSWKKFKRFFNTGHIYHRLDDLTVIWVIYYTHGRTWPTVPERVTQPQVPPHVLAHAKLVTRVPVCGHFWNVYDHPFFMKKKFKRVFEYEPYITPIKWLNRCNISHSE